MSRATTRQYAQREGTSPPPSSPYFPAKLDSKLKLEIMLGDEDTSVDGRGARLILARLELAHFPGSQVQLIGIKSTKSFKADHFSAMKTSPGAKAEIWRPADRLIDSVR